MKSSTTIAYDHHSSSQTFDELLEHDETNILKIFRRTWPLSGIHLRATPAPPRRSGKADCSEDSRAVNLEAILTVF